MFQSPNTGVGGKDFGGKPYEILIVEYSTGKAIRTLASGKSYKECDRADDALQHNLNHEKYFTLIVEVELA